MALDFDAALMTFGEWLDGKLAEEKPVKNGKGVVIGSRKRYKLADLLDDQPATGLIDLGMLAGMAGVKVIYDE